MLLGWGADFDRETPSRKTPVDLAYIKNDENPGYLSWFDAGKLPRLYY